MDMHSRNQYLRSLVEKQGYHLASRKQKSKVLDEFCRHAGLNRKYAIAKIRSGKYLELKEQVRRKRETHYTNETIQALKKVWRLFERPCGQRLESILADEVDHLISLGELVCSKDTVSQLKTISARTIDEKLKLVKNDEGLKRKYSSKIHPLLYQKIPIKTFFDQDRKTLGNIQTDLVEHCGASANGPFVATVSSADIYCGWWVGASVMGTGSQAVAAALANSRAESPFIWASLHSDNGKEFINKRLYRYCQKEAIPFSRSRPYKKNDNCLAEQKHKTHVRGYVGHQRYDTIEELEILNELWPKVAEFRNFFCPSMKLMQKERISGHVRRRYDRPKTPYQRLLEYKNLSEQTKRELQDYYSSLNPVRLRQEIRTLQDTLLRVYEEKQRKAKGRSVRFSTADQGATSVR